MHKEVSELLNRMLAKSIDITLTTNQCIRICQKYNITGAQLGEAIRRYCFEKDINLFEYEEETILI